MANQSASLNLLFYALADPTRRAVVQRLTRGEATVSELARPFDMALPSFLKHLSVLEKSRLVTSRKRGRVRTCSLQVERLETTERWLGALSAQWADRHENLDTLLMTMGGDDGLF
jgi:DNA-binding transcriptional ArsR family regulator